MKRFYTLFIFIISFGLAGAQQNLVPCITDEIWAIEKKNNPSFAEQLQDVELNFQKFRAKKGEQPLGAKFIIPVVFHIIHENGSENISDAQCEDQVRIFNEDYSNSNPQMSKLPSAFQPLAASADIEFRLAKKDPNGNPTNGITRHVSSAKWLGTKDYAGNPGILSAVPDAAWPNDKYFNVYVTKTIEPGVQVGGAILGYTDWNAGIQVRHDVVGSIGTAGTFTSPGSTPSHEGGHWLGLNHLWESQGNVCDDGISDTPKQGKATFSNSCPAFPKVSSCQQDGTSNGPNGDMFMNLMDYSKCRYFFTVGQVSKMHSMLNSSYRKKLWSAANLTATGVDQVTPQPPVADFSANTQTVCGSGSVQFTDKSSNTPTQWSWSFSGGSPSSSTQQNPSVTYSSPGTYNVTLTAKSANGSDSKTESGYITVVGSGQAVPLSEDFESTFPKAGWKVNNPDNLKTWTKTNTGKGSASSVYMNNFAYDQANGQIDELVLPTLSFTGGHNTMYLEFDVAYTTYSPFTDNYSERLEVLVSKDCGESFTTVYNKRAPELATRTNTDQNFVPTKDEWRHETLDLKSFLGYSSVIIKFKHTCDWENNLYLDNINVHPTIGIGDVDNIETEMTVFPNPAKEHATVSFTLNNTQQVKLQVFDVLGKEIYAITDRKLPEGTHQFQLTETDLKGAGVYFVRLTTENGQVTRKVSVY